MQYVILAVLVILVIAFFVMVWKASPYWRWYALTTASLTMILAVVFIFPTAIVLKSRSAWHKIKEDLETRYDGAVAQQKVLNFGDPTDPTAGPGAVDLNQQLAQLGTEAGRHWRGLRVSNIQDRAITLVQPPRPEDDPAAGGDDNAPAPADGAQQTLVPGELVVHAFADQPRPGFEFPVPNFYLGEFRVTASDANTVTIEPTTPLQPQQEQVIGNRQAVGWSLYELLPLDGHQVFIAAGSEPDDENLFGRPDEELIRSLLGDSVSEEILQSYMRDGSRATPEDPIETVWNKIEFLKPYTLDVDSPTQSGVLQGGFFDGSGRALDSRLQHGGEKGVQFKQGDQLVVKQEAAEKLFDEDVAKLIDKYYVRPLNDYRFGIRNIRLRLKELAMRKAELEFENNVLQEATRSSQNLLVEYQDEALKLEQDLAQTRIETEAITEYIQTLESRVKETRETLVRLYRSNQEIENEIQRVYASLN
ncbi:hypothetical protein [Crateriforma spongiae]|uniref:hypothetical protein n=1 Tax=Crateriforma spongiae TaxID=2724528 RepID=UPI001447741E|nr:hypothetical protein [Crateriforma spongiae]